nr:calpain-12-like [Anolis sagrei ordinatus]
MATHGITIQLHSCPDTIKEDGQVQPFNKRQNYKELKQECLQKKCLFEDPEFEASLQSLGYDIRNPDTWSYSKLSWKRPGDIVTIGRPHFINEGMTLQDVRQFGLGDCWFMAAAACLTLNKELLCRVVPPNQSFAEWDYAGIFHFQFWHYGKWVDVVVDDRLPVLDGELHFAVGNDSHDFWMPLLEKAYAKLYGSYHAIVGGFLNEAFVDLTGGIGKRIILSDIQSNRFETIKFALEKKSLLGASVLELKDQDSGLGRRHAYSITGVYKLNIGGREQKLLRLRNPWGETEWTRSWSDWSDKWSSLDPAVRNELNVQEEDGEFWIELDDFTTNFATVDICYLSINSFDKEGVQTFWKTTNIEGAWTKETSGGNTTQKTFWSNPRFLFSLRKPNDPGKESELQKYSCAISLVQKSRGTRNQRRKLFFYIFQDLQLLTTTQDDQLLSGLRYADEASDHDGSRALTQKFQLTPGDYLLIPSTEFADEEGDFILRIFTEANHECL